MKSALGMKSAATMLLSAAAATIAVIMLSGTCVVGVQAKKDLGTCSSSSECSSGYCAGGFCCYSSTGPNCAECYNEIDGDCRTCSPGYSEPTKDNGYTCEELEADACAAFSSSKAKCKKSAKKGLACSYSSRKGCVCARSMSVRTDAASLCVVCIAL